MKQNEDISRRIATVVDLDVTRMTVLSALHDAVRSGDPDLARSWKKPSDAGWRDLRTHPQYGPVAQWLWDVEGRSCELKYELVALFGDDWSLLNALLCDELGSRRTG